MANLQIRGTVFSGSALDTTLGNTLRGIVAMRTLAKFAAAPVEPRVNGDDLLVAHEWKDAPAVRRAARWLLSSRLSKAVRSHGIGHTVKFLDTREHTTTTCSKDVVLGALGSTTRPPRRILATDRKSVV